MKSKEKTKLMSNIVGVQCMHQKTKTYNNPMSNVPTSNIQHLTSNVAITLIALIVTIIVLLILAGVSISMLTGENGLIKKAIEAKEQTQIKTYAEKIELIKTELKLSNEGYADPTIEQLKNEFETNQTKWVNSTKIITDEMDNDIEKLKLTTKEGYIFYITGTTTEYKGKNGEIVDTSDLEKGDVLELKKVGTSKNGEKVQITDLSGKNYYKIKYKIGETGEWKEIQSGEQVEVAYGETIIAKLIYGSNEGIEHKLAIGHTSPTVEVSDIDLTNVERTTNIALADIFNVTWGSEGTGEINYKVNGTLNFKDTNFSSENINNIAELEIGTYKIDCYVATPTQVENNESEHKEEWTKEVRITELAETTVTNASNSTVSAKAIYSEYDLAYFRDLVNGGNSAINAKVMKDIDLANVCSATVGSWKPIGGDYKYTQSLSENELNASTIYYSGIFDGNNKNINNIYLNESNTYRRGLFSIVREKSIIKNVIISGTVTAYQGSGAIVGCITEGKLINCTNNVQIEGTNSIGGIVGTTANQVTIKDCKNNGNVNATGYNIGGIVGYNRTTVTNCLNNAAIVGGSIVGGIAGNNEGTIDTCCNIAEINSNQSTSLNGDTGKGSYTGGIAGYNGSNIKKCINKEKVEAVYRGVGGITGRNYGTIEDCCNAGDVKGEAVIGGIVGNNRGYILRVYNIADKIEATLSTEGYVGGIAGNQNSTSNAYIKYTYNKAKIIGNIHVGGCIGTLSIGTLSNVYNIGTIQASNAAYKGEVYGYTYSASAITNSGSTTESTMKGWSQATITSKIGAFTKKTNALPILNITLPIYNNYVF